MLLRRLALQHTYRADLAELSKPKKKGMSVEQGGEGEGQGGGGEGRGWSQHICVCTPVESAQCACSHNTDMLVALLLWNACDKSRYLLSRLLLWHCTSCAGLKALLPLKKKKRKTYYNQDQFQDGKQSDCPLGVIGVRCSICKLLHTINS